MYDNLLFFFVKLFTQIEYKKKNGFIILKSGLCINVCCSTYEKLILVDVMPIDSIPQEEKIKYWNIAKEYYPEKQDAIKASKAAYIISLLTQNENATTIE